MRLDSRESRSQLRSLWEIGLDLPLLGLSAHRWNTPTSLVMQQ